jgi:hypothetical protein
VAGVAATPASVPAEVQERMERMRQALFDSAPGTALARARQRIKSHAAPPTVAAFGMPFFIARRSLSNGPTPATSYAAMMFLAL